MAVDVQFIVAFDHEFVETVERPIVDRFLRRARHQGSVSCQMFEIVFRPACTLKDFRQESPVSLFEAFEELALGGLYRGLEDQSDGFFLFVDENVGEDVRGNPCFRADALKSRKVDACRRRGGRGF